MDEQTLHDTLLRLAEGVAGLQAGQAAILQRLDSMEAARIRDKADDKLVADRVTRLEERQQVLWRFVWGAVGAGGGGLAGGLYTLLQTISG